MSELVSENDELIAKVQAQLARYEQWEARESARGVEVTVRLKQPGLYDDPYRFYLTPREIEAPGFEWEFQRQLYNFLHDYLVEMFTRSPHIREG